jgi:signal transduction histidine kinase/CheY-like chemotaxis protein
LECGFEGLDDATAGIAVWDSDQTLVYASQAFASAFLLERGPLHGMTFSRFLEIVTASRELVLDVAPDIWREGMEAEFGREARFEQAMADGRTLEIIQRPSRRGGMTVTVHDVTLLKRVEFALRRTAREAEAAGEAKSRFLRAANHDLRQPLATLRILIYNCMSEADEEHRRDLLHAMDLSVSIMEDLLGALLQIGQLDAGQIAARVTTFQLGQIFERLEVQFAHQAAEKGLRLRFVPTRESVVSDKALLERILSNLVANAIRYTTVGGVLIGCRRHGDSFQLQIWDTGRGIAPEHVERIFDEFYQIPDGRLTNRQGLGLGLNIVRRLSDLLQHPVTVRSWLGRGSIFCVSVPAGDVWQSDFGEPEISEMIGGEFAGVPILLIEDDEALRRATEELLERWGVLVSAVSSGTEALALLTKGLLPRMVIADYSLRGQLGTDVVETIRSALGQDVPAVIITADVEPTITEYIASCGFPLLIKPVSPPRLRVMMHHLLFEPSEARQTQQIK